MSTNLRKELALAQYRLRAKHYDNELAAFEPIRRCAIANLQLRAGEVVLDVGCGTGLSFAMLHQAVGMQGRVIGIEQSPEMIAIANERVVTHGWRNVTLLPAAAELAQAGVLADAALFHFTHDILSSATAVANVVRQLKPGARLVASGLQWSHPWDWPTNTLVLAAAMYSMTTLDNLQEPWSRLKPLCGPIDKLPSTLAGTYIVRTSLCGAQAPPK